ncbi:HNH endonuclease [Cytobacillus oceanisediminis]|uniref:HNH endonuclease n=1 Tax=Cytobacillus oceanisediminis TaxID=665099 RepID=UPI001C23E3FF|nr:HNH endonuclease [Cytobacillus oceanisediminis]MBU8770311.1 HNH endonuclease [Cytobacillus oceanisediminis]
MIKPIPGYEGYFVDSSGNVFSKWINKGRHGKVMGRELRKIKGSKTKRGHVYVRFGRKAKPLYIHRLVYQVFVGEIAEGLLIRHLNDIPYDNRVENLSIGTQKENMEDARKNKLFPLGSKNGQSKLTEKDVKEIRKLAKTNTKTELANKYQVSRAAIREAVNNNTWKHVN